MDEMFAVCGRCGSRTRVTERLVREVPRPVSVCCIAEGWWEETWVDRSEVERVRGEKQEAWWVDRSWWERGGDL